MYRTTRKILSLANGGARWRKGDPIAPGVLPDAAWQRLINEGAVVEVSPPLPDGPAKIDATPAAVELAGELGVDLADVAGSGADGRVLVSDVRAAVKE